MMNNRELLLYALIGLGLFTVSSSVVLVDQREQGILFHFREIQGETYGPGMHWKLPFVQSIKTFDTRILSLDNQTEEFLTLEQKQVEVDFYVKWRIVDPVAYYRATGGEELVALDRLAAIVKNALLNEFGRRTIQQAISEGREAFTTAVGESTSEQIAQFGIDILDVRVKRIDLPDEVRESVYERMRAERTRVASELRAQGAEIAEKIRAEADREAQIIVANAYREAEKVRGEGDARAARIYARAYGQDPDFYSFSRSLKVYREAWRDGQDVMVLEPKGELFRYFNRTKP